MSKFYAANLICLIQKFVSVYDASHTLQYQNCHRKMAREKRALYTSPSTDKRSFLSSTFFVIFTHIIFQ